jgi:dolichol-phosphate mannosyltransferase
MYLDIIIPCYNEEAVISETHRRIIEVMANKNFIFEITYVNDGSKDKTLQILKEIANTDSRVKILDFSRNFGHQPAVSAGLANSNSEFVAIIDADLQDPPECILEMLEKAEQDQADVVYGVREVRKGETWFKKMTAKAFYRMLNYFSEYKIPVDTGDFRLMRRNVVEAFNQLPERQKYIRGLVAWLGFKQVPIFYKRDARFAGETHYPFFKMVSFAMRGLLYFSKKPLQISTNLGISCVVFALLFLSISLVRYFIDKSSFASGWTSTITLVVFFGGIQLITIGVLGAYLGNLFDEVKGRPEYIIKKIYQKDADI